MRTLTILDRVPDPPIWRNDIVAESPAMLALLALVAKVGPSTIPVLILGETGVGKEVIAHALHAASGRTGPLVAVNCAALPLPLAESELFGHVRGAFTGADGGSDGLIAASSGGTILLDEIGDLDLAVQAKLLRALDEGAIRMLGSTATVSVDLRIVAATCRDLRAAVRERRFREDLYHRLAGVILTVPPLRDRPEDIIPLARRFLAEQGGRGRELPTDTIAWLRSEPWLGNARELRQAVRRAVVFGSASLHPEDFLVEHLVPRVSPPVEPSWLIGRTWDEIEAAVLGWAIAHYGSVRAAATALGRSRSTIYDRIRILGIGHAVCRR